MWSFFSRDPAKDFAYDIGEKVPGFEDSSSWSLHDGKRKVSRLVEGGVVLFRSEFQLNVNSGHVWG